MNILTRSSCAALAIWIGVVAASANESKELSRAEYLKDASDLFEKLDTNFDGFVSEDEINAESTVKQKKRDRKDFKRMDINADGQISFEEYSAERSGPNGEFTDEMEQQLVEFFAAVDTDKNDNVSLDEFKNFVRKQFGEMNSYMTENQKRLFDDQDIDGDGLISRQEYVDKVDAFGRSKDENGQDASAGAFKDIETFTDVPAHDGNNDGRISKMEDDIFRKALFDAMDQNNDNILAPEERLTFGAQMIEDKFLAASGTGKAILYGN